MDPEEYSRIAASENSHWWYRTVRRLLADVVSPLLVPETGRYLDAGCGPGGNSSWVPSGRFQIFGLDIADEAVQYARRMRPEMKVVRAGIERIPFADASFDGLQSITVLCHELVESEEAALREYARVLRPAGLLLCIEPAFEIFRRSHDRVVQARRRYRLTDLTERIASSGFEVIFGTYFFAILSLPALALAIADRVMGRRTYRSDLQRSGLLDPLFWAAGSAERALVRASARKTLASARRKSESPMLEPENPMLEAENGMLGSASKKPGRPPLPIGTSVFVVAQKK
jgi:SAM-dependent methyltransferase